MGNYNQDSKELLLYIGGKENIAAVTHCVTRMRFVLKDPSLAEVEKIEQMKIVKGTFTQAGQFQVIIGNAVSDFYNDFLEVSGLEGVSKDSVKQAAKQNQNLLQRAVSVIAEIFAPLIPAIIVGGLILGFRNCIDSLYLFENGTKTLCELSQFWAGIDSFLWLIGEAVFHVGIPVGICWAVMKKMGGTEMLGIVLGLTLVSGQLLNAYAVASTAAADIPYWDFGAFQINMIGYQAQVLPAILAALTLAYLERFFRKISPQAISMIIVPFFSLVLSVIAAHFVLGPIGWKIGSAISSVVYAGITGSFKTIFGGIFGFVYAPLVITGLHHMTNAIDLQLIADYEGTLLWPMIALSNIAQGSAVLAMTYIQRKNAQAEEVNIPACISCYLGVTEPAIFGVNLKHVFPFICGMIGSALAGVTAISFNVTATAIGVGGLPGILSIQPAYMLKFALCAIIAIVVPFVLTCFIAAKKGYGEDICDTKVAPEETSFHAFASGEVIPLKEVNDGVFSKGVLGDGLAIRPDGDTLYAPIGGTISMTMEESGHACAISCSNGLQVMLHIGLDTVKMNGAGFEYLIQKDQTVSAGTPLIRFDRAKIKAAGYQDVIICVITENSNDLPLEFHTGMTAKAKETTIITF